jgi:hypothetical protein
MRTPSKTSPVGGNRGCLCKDGKTYSRKCCDGSILAQGIGSLVDGNTSVVTNEDTTRIESETSSPITSTNNSNVTNEDTTRTIVRVSS